MSEIESANQRETIHERQQRHEALADRLYNFKFGQALPYLAEWDDPEVIQTVHALHASYSNSGWIFGNEGMIVLAAVRRLHDMLGVPWDHE